MAPKHLSVRARPSYAHAAAALGQRLAEELLAQAPLASSKANAGDAAPWRSHDESGTHRTAASRVTRAEPSDGPLSSQLRSLG